MQTPIYGFHPISKQKAHAAVVLRIALLQSIRLHTAAVPDPCIEGPAYGATDL